MKYSKALEVLEKELTCARNIAQGTCEQKCTECEYLQDDIDILGAYEKAIQSLREVAKNEEG